MKKFAALFALVAAFAVVALAPGHALAANGQTIISGTFKKPDGSVIKNAAVTVTCNGKEKYDVTDNDGEYLVTYGNDANCPVGATVTVEAQKNKLEGSSTGTVRSLQVRLNVAAIDVVAVPEFGTVAAITASLAGVGAIGFARRRKAGSLA